MHCEQCKKPYLECVCPDLRPQEDWRGHFYHYFDRYAEEWARWLRSWGIIK